MKLAFVQSLPFALVAIAAVHAACGDGATSTGEQPAGPAQSTGGIYEPECNGGVQDGFCNALGDVPESCECLDCTETAYCTGACSNDGTCSADEDCTCEDCFDADPECPGTGEGPSSTSASTTTAATTTSTTTTTSGAGGGGGGGGSGDGGAGGG